MSFRITEKGYHVVFCVLANGGVVDSSLAIKKAAVAIGISLDDAVAWTKERLTTKTVGNGVELQLAVSPTLRYEVVARSLSDAFKLLFRTMLAAR